MLNLSNPPNKITIFFNKNLDRILYHLTFQSKPISTSTATTILVPTHDNIAHLILDQKTVTQALQTFKWATTLPNFTHNQSTYRALIHKLCAFRRFDTVYHLLDEMPSSISSPPNDEIFITIIRGLGRARNVRDVIKVLDLFFKFYNKKPNVKLYNAILNVLVKEDINIAREFYRRKMMGCGIDGDDYTYGILMKGLCSTNRIADAFRLLQVIKARDDVRPNVVVYNTLIHGLCKNGKLGVGRARSLMNEMVDPNDVTFNVMITAYCREENLVQALVMLEKCFSSGFVPDVITVTKMVDILCSNGRAMEAVEVLERVESKGGKIDVVAYNTLIKGFCKLGRPKVGMRLLKEMEYKGCLPNVETYNTLILGFCECGSLDSALDLFNEMKMVGISWNFITYDTLIHGLCSEGRMEDGYKILELMEDSKGGSKGHVSPYNSIIYGLHKVNRVDEALEFLSKMKILFPRAVDRSLKILGLCDEGIIENAKRVYDQMIEEGDIPSILVYLSLIHRFCQEDRVREALEMMNEMIGRGYLATGPMLNVLITALCKNEKIGRASKLLEDMVGRDCLPDSGSYSPLVEAFCKKGDFHKALMLFMQMVEKGIVPTYSSWNSLVICLCQETTWCENKNVLHVSNLVQRILKN